MAKRTFKAGVTNQTIDLFIQDSSSTIGAGLSGLVFNSAGLAAYYRAGPTATPVAISLVTQTVGGAFSAGGFVEVDSVHMKGVYRLDLPNAVLTASPYSVVYLYGATNMAPCIAELEIVAYDPFDAVRMGITALPNAAAQAAGGLYTNGSGAGQIHQTANGQIDVNAVACGGVNLTGRDIGQSVLVSVGTGAGQLSVSAGVVAANVGTVAASLSSSERNAVADALLDRDMSVGVDSGSPTVRTVRQALRFLRNKWSVSGTTLTVCKEDDASTSWVSALTGTVGASPITSSDPA